MLAFDALQCLWPGLVLRCTLCSIGTRTLSMQRHAQVTLKLTGVPLVQIYTAGLDGKIHLWQYETAKIESTWSVSCPVESMVLPSRHSAVLCVHWSKRKTGRMVLFDLSRAQEPAQPASAEAEPSLQAVPAASDASAPQTTQLAEGTAAQPAEQTAAHVPHETKVCKLQKPVRLDLSPDHNFVVAVDGHRVVVLCLKHDKRVLTMIHTRELTVRIFLSCAVLTCSGCRKLCACAEAMMRSTCIPRADETNEEIAYTSAL